MNFDMKSNMTIRLIQQIELIGLQLIDLSDEFISLNKHISKKKYCIKKLFVHFYRRIFC